MDSMTGRRAVWMAALALALVLGVGGCGKQRLQDAPPGARAASPAPARAEEQADQPGLPPVYEEGPAAVRAQQAPEAAAAEAEAQADQVQPATSADLPPEPEQTDQGQDLVQRELDQLRQSDGAAGAATGPYYVQVGAFAQPERAQAVMDGLVAEGYEGSRVVFEDGLYRVQAGSFDDLETTRQALQSLRQDYPASFIP